MVIFHSSDHLFFQIMPRAQTRETAEMCDYIGKYTYCYDHTGGQLASCVYQMQFVIDTGCYGA